jgi:hypothetical protein
VQTALAHRLRTGRGFYDAVISKTW